MKIKILFVVSLLFVCMVCFSIIISIRHGNTVSVVKPEHSSIADKSVADAVDSYWQSPKILTFFVQKTEKNSLIVKVPNYVEVPNYISMDGGWKILSLKINQNTLIWQDGKLIPYSKSSGLKSNELASVLVQEQGSNVIAKEIYGPLIQVWGKIEKVSKGALVVQELEYTETPDTLKHPTGNILNMVYDSRTLFDPGCSPDSLKPGDIIQTTAIGRIPAKLLIQGIDIYSEQPTQ